MVVSPSATATPSSTSTISTASAPNLSVANLADGDYLIGAYAYSVDVAGGNCATLELTVGRQSIVRSVRMLEGEWVELAEVSTRGGSTTITALEGQPGAVCR
jgi:hypothetical protein